MNTKHTPSPWVIDETGDGTLVVTSTHDKDESDNDICELIGDSDSPTVKINAKLIAAAPELLEVIGRCADFMGSVAGTENVSDTFKLALFDAREAIAKATY